MTTAPQIPRTPEPTTPTTPTATPNSSTDLDLIDLPADNAQEDGQVAATVTDDDDVDPSFVDFETLLSTPAAPAPAATPAEPAAPVVPQAPAQAASPQQPASQEPPAPQTPPQEAAPQQAPQTPQTPTTPVVEAQPNADQTQVLSTLRAELDKNREQVVNAVAQHYEATITDEDVDLLQTEPKKALARMAGRVHADGLSNILAVMSQNLPGMVYALMSAQQQQQRAADSFYEKFPQFDRSKHGQAVEQIAKTVRQLNPQMDGEAFMTLVGAMATQHLGLQAAVAPAQTPPAAAPAPVARAPRGFAPAGASQVASRPAPAGGQANPWEALAEVMQD